MHRKGKLLETTIANLFTRADFKVEINSKRFGFESDVIISKASFKAIIECKQYNIYLNLKSLIHEWKSKANEAKVSKVILVIYGRKPIKSDFELAKKLGVILWDYETIDKLNSIGDKIKLNNKLNKILHIDKKTQRNAKIIESIKRSLKIFGIVVLPLLFFILLFSNPVYASYVFLGALWILIFWALMNKKPRKRRRR